MARDEMTHEQLARKAGDPNRLVDGEDPNSTDATDAGHWVGIYKEMLTFKERVLESAETVIAGLSVVAQEELEPDIQILKLQQTRLQRQLRFWEARRAELTVGV